MKYARIHKAICSMPWMIQPEKLEAFMELLELRIEGGKLSPEEIADRTAHPRQGESHDCVLYAVDDLEIEARDAVVPAQGPQNVAVLPVYGVISHRPSMDVSSGGGFNIQRFRTRFRDAIEDPSISAIVMDFDSPGGTVDGVEEMAKEIYQARGKKKIVAVSNTLAASAAYYLASAAGELAVTPSGEVGSIGVYMLHQDASDFYSQKGIKNTLIKAGKYKAEGNPWMALDEEALANLQRSVDAHYDMFVKAVARNRGVSVDTVRSGFGEGRTVMAKEAVKLGMADKVATLDEVLKSLGVKNANSGKKASGVTETPETHAETDLEPQAETAAEQTDVDGELVKQLRQRELDML